MLSILTDIPWTVISRDFSRSSDMDAPVKATVLVADAAGVAAAPPEAAAASEFAIWSLRAIFLASSMLQRVLTSPQFMSMAFLYSAGMASLNLTKYSLFLVSSVASVSNLFTALLIRVARAWRLSCPSHTIVLRRACQLYLSSGFTRSCFNSGLTSGHVSFVLLPYMVLALSSNFRGSHFRFSACIAASSAAGCATLTDASKSSIQESKSSWSDQKLLTGREYAGLSAILLWSLP